MSLQYVNFMNCMVIFGVGASGVGGGGWLYGCPMTHKMSGLNLVLQWQFWVLHVCGNSHVGTVFSRGRSLYLPAFISV